VTSGGDNFNDFLIINWPKFVYLLVDPGLLSPIFKFIWSIAPRSPTRWTPLADTTDNRTCP